MRFKITSTEKTDPIHIRVYNAGSLVEQYDYNLGDEFSTILYEAVGQYDVYVGEDETHYLMNTIRVPDGEYTNCTRTIASTPTRTDVNVRASVTRQLGYNIDFYQCSLWDVNRELLDTLTPIETFHVKKGWTNTHIYVTTIPDTDYVAIIDHNNEIYPVMSFRSDQVTRSVKSAPKSVESTVTSVEEEPKKAPKKAPKKTTKKSTTEKE